MDTEENRMINIILFDKDKWICEGIKHIINENGNHEINCANKMSEIKNFVRNDKRNIIICEIAIENANIYDTLRNIQFLCMKNTDVAPIILTRIEDTAMIGFINHHYPELPVITKSENASFIHDFIFSHTEPLEKIKERKNDT